MHFHGDCCVMPDPRTSQFHHAVTVSTDAAIIGIASARARSEEPSDAISRGRPIALSIAPRLLMLS